MPFVVVKVGNDFRVKNSTTGKVGRDRFKKKENAVVQMKNRERFIRLMKSKTGLTSDSKKPKKK
tara:strand:+ start:316 stop:507 length:192 start_codon:yes stop_codon:yes gene_type:complete